MLNFECLMLKFTMGIKEAVRAAKMIQTKWIIGVHYDTFGFIKIAGKKQYIISAVMGWNCCFRRLGGD